MKWFKHDTDANLDNRLQNVLLDYGLEGFGLYWYCLEVIAGRVDKDNVNFELEHDARVIARNTGSTPQKVEEMMRYLVSVGLFENTEGVITCMKMAKRLDKSMTSNPEMRKIIESMNATSTQLDGFVYFIEKRDSSGEVIAIKIGRSKNPSSRLNEISRLEENIGYSLEILHKKFSENCVEMETKLHRKFKALRFFNEWFRPDESIYDYIKNSYDMMTTDYDMQDKIRLDQMREEKRDLLSSGSEVVFFDPVESVISHLNEVTGAKYRASTRSHAQHISGRLADGHSVDDLKRVIDEKASEWLHDKNMCLYLRPQTLFSASKFQGYLRQANTEKTRQHDARFVSKPSNDIPEGFR